MLPHATKVRSVAPLTVPMWNEVSELGSSGSQPNICRVDRPACDDNLDWAGSTVTRVRHFFIALIAARWGIMRAILLLLDVDWVGRDEMKLAYVHHR